MRAAEGHARRGGLAPNTEDFVSVYPYTGEEAGRYAPYTASETEEALQAMSDDGAILASCAPAERADALNAVADMLHSKREKTARLITSETGKLLTESYGEVDKSVACLRYYADHTEDFLEPKQARLADGTVSRACYEPIGSVLAIMPWNFPLWQVIRCLAPNMALGNAVGIKHASNVQGCAGAIEELVTETLNLRVAACLRVPSSGIDKIIKDERIAAVTLTGGERAGAAVAMTAAAYLKKSVLELGGSDPYLVLDDADVAHAAKTCVQARFLNAGQSCIAAKRVIVSREIYDDFIAAVLEETKKLIPGDPEREETTLAPLAKREACTEMQEFVNDAIACGAKLAQGTKYKPEEHGHHFAAAVLIDANETMRVFHEETFGPVMSIIPANGEHHALFLANFTDYGLGGAVFSKDTERAFSVARKLRTGGAAINAMYRSAPEAPFGGVGKSGYGNELGGAAGLAEFANLKNYLFPAGA